METTEHPALTPEPAATADEPVRRATSKPRRAHAPLLTLAVIALATAAVVAITVSLYPFGQPAAPAQVPSARHTIGSAALAPLTVLPAGQGADGCADAHSLADRFALCTADLSGTWAYDAGLNQSPSAAATGCTNAVAEPADTWADLDNAVVHVHEQIRQYPSAARAQAAAAAATGNPANLCSNLGAANAVVQAQGLARPPAAHSAAAWSVPNGARTWDLILIVVDRGVIRLDVAPLAGTAGVPVSQLQQIATAAADRYLNGQVYALLQASAAP